MIGLDWKWSEPIWFLGLLILPFVYLTAKRHFQKRVDLLNAIYGKEVFKFLSSSVSITKVKAKLICEIFAFGFFCLALARPQFGEKPQSIKSQGIELMILFDVSESMLAEDMAPSRLEFAKNQVHQLIDLLPGTKAGLVAFAGGAALVSPITTDASALKMFVDYLSTDSISTQGTDFRKAFEEAAGAFERGGQSVDQTTRVTRAVLVISDGEDQEEGAIEAASQMAEKGIRIFTVAVGTEKGAAIPQRDQNNLLRGYKKSKDGKEIVTQVHGDALKTFAQKGNGSFYYSSLDSTYIQHLADDLNKLDKAEFDTQFITQYEERYQGFLFLGIIFIFISLLLNSRIKNYGLWKGRFQTTLVFCFIFIFSSLTIKVNKANAAIDYWSSFLSSKNLKAENFTAAEAESLKGLTESPFVIEHHLNFGISQEGLGRVQKALGSYRMAEELAEETGRFDLVFVARFNQAQLLAKDKKINEAIEMYQKALEVNPQSKETKINIELLIQQQQQQGGKGGGEGEDKDQKSEDQDGGGEGKDQQKNKEPKDVKQNQQYKPNKFKAQDISEDQAKKILEELKRHEQQIHQNFDQQNKMNKDMPNEKDW